MELVVEIDNDITGRWGKNKSCRLTSAQTPPQRAWESVHR